MRKREILSVLAVPVTVAAVLGGFPAFAGATTGATGTGPAGAPGYGPLTPALTRQLAADPSQPVIVVLKSQAGQDGGTAGTVGPAAAAAQKSVVGELQSVGATGIKRYSLVNSVAATVSSLEAQRLAADPAVAEVLPDATFSIDDPAPAPAATGRLLPVRTTSLKPHNIPGACAPKGKSQLAPEGLALTGTASDSASAKTARTLGFTGAGVKVAYIADGIDPGNVNFKRKNGTSAFADVQDFTGNGPNAPTGGGEAFLDANTIAGQGLKTYNVNGFSAQAYPGSCDVRIQGVAPGASLVGLNVFSEDRSHLLSTTTSMFVQAINYAVETAKVNVLNESFGGNPLPDSTADVVKQFDDAAVKAGVVVSVSTGDAGTASTIGSPATDPNLISAGATTQFQAYAQSNQSGTRYFASKGWLSDNISAISSSGFDESGGTVNLVAPGDLSWASCTANPVKFSDCGNSLGQPSDIMPAGGTSEAAPFVSGAAALVFQAFRAAHHGANPTPAQVKRILLSTATDLGTPAQDQGAGLLNSYRAVQLAQSYGASKRTGATIVSSAGQLTSQTLPGVAKTWKITVTNAGAAAQAVTVTGRALDPASTFSAHGSVTLSNAASNQYTGAGGEQDNYATFKFRVPAGQGRLNVAIAYAANAATVQSPPTLTLFDPQGRVAGNSLPQGVGNFGNADVRAPATGLWTAVVASPAGDQGFTGKVSWQATTQKYRSFGSASPSSLTLGPGKSGSFVLSVKAPAQPGDLAGSVLLHASAGGVTSIPVVVRSLIDTAGGGTFSGTLTGGNGRQALGTSDFYQFNVPAGQPALRAEFALASNPSPGNPVGAYLVSPDGEVQGYGQNSSSGGTAIGVTNKTLTASVVAPAAGRWTLILAFASPTAGLAVSVPFTGSVSFTAPATLVPSTPLPQGTELEPGQPLTIPVTITNRSNAPQDYFLDPRLTTEATVKLTPFVFGAKTAFAAASTKTPLPTPNNAKTTLYFVPSDDFSFGYRQTSSVPAMTTMTTLNGGDPSVGDGLGLSRQSLCGTDITGSYVAPGGVLASGAWMLDPTECGPFRTAAPAGVATDAVFADMAAFDPGVAVQTGDFERLAVNVTAGNSAVNKAVELQPGQSARVNVTFKVPAGTPAGTRRGVLYLDTLQGSVPPNGQFAGDQVTALPYSYVIPDGSGGVGGAAAR